MHTGNTFHPQFVLFPLGNKLVLLGDPVREGNCWTVFELELVHWGTSSCGDKLILVGISSLVCSVSLGVGNQSVGVSMLHVFCGIFYIGICIHLLCCGMVILLKMGSIPSINGNYSICLK